MSTDNLLYISMKHGDIICYDIISKSTIWKININDLQLKSKLQLLISSMSIDDNTLFVCDTYNTRILHLQRINGEMIGMSKLQFKFGNFPQDITVFGSNLAVKDSRSNLRIYKDMNRDDYKYIDYDSGVHTIKYSPQRLVVTHLHGHDLIDIESGDFIERSKGFDNYKFVNIDKCTGKACLLGDVNTVLNDIY